MSVWIEVVGSFPSVGVVADGKALAAGEIAQVSAEAARRLVAYGQARLADPPGLDRPAADLRRRTR